MERFSRFWRECLTEGSLRGWLRVFLGLRFPARGVCAGHCSPFEYLWRAYHEPEKDLVVWAPRGGGKTRLGAVATLLDLVHKPGISVRILGGSMEQSLRMWEYLMPDVEKLAGDGAKLRFRRMRLANGSVAGVVTQSERAVRGLRVQKIRCDEVELFDEGVWSAAQLVTKSAELKMRRKGGWEKVLVRGAVEALSTCHRPGGLMERIVEKAEEGGTRVLRWCLMEALVRCEKDRDCASCPLLEDCGRRAKTECDGFVSIDDAIAMKRRVSKEVWESEMMCRRPSSQGCVFGTFDVGVHVREGMAYVRGGELMVSGAGRGKEGLYLGIDFGFKNPFVCLWIRRDELGRSFVIDEHVQEKVEVVRHIEEIKARGHGEVRRVGCDPAGAARDEQTGESNVNLLRAAGFRVGCRGSRIVDGLEMIRAGLRSGTGEVSLFIHPRCKRLIQAMRSYRYGEGRAETPVKDGPDHLIDALRYYFVNRDGGRWWEEDIERRILNAELRREGLTSDNADELFFYPRYPGHLRLR